MDLLGRQAACMSWTRYEPGTQFDGREPTWVELLLFCILICGTDTPMPGPSKIRLRRLLGSSECSGKNLLCCTFRTLTKNFCMENQRLSKFSMVFLPLEACEKAGGWRRTMFYQPLSGIFAILMTSTLPVASILANLCHF